jgi:hypothetical protein
VVQNSTVDNTEFELIVPFTQGVPSSAEDAFYEFRIFVKDVENNLAEGLAFYVSPLRFFIVEQRSCGSDSDKKQMPAHTTQHISGKFDREFARREPFVSIIFAGSNDSPRFLGRTCLMLSFLTKLITSQNVSAEIIVVDWASSPAIPSFGTQIAQKCILFWSLRIIVVPPQLNHELQQSYYKNFPSIHDDIANLHVNIQLAKNVGARCAFGEFLVFINGDTLIPPALLFRLQLNTLKKGYIYRAARWELDIVGANSADSGLFSDVAQVFERFESDCNIAQGTRFADLNEACWTICMPSSHCFAFDPRHKCIATDTEYVPAQFCPNLIGFEDFCKDGVTPELTDPDIIFSDASGVQCSLIDR